MSSAIDDLWPTDIASVTDELPPITILKQQASLLGQRTRNIVEAKVETTTTDFQRFLRHTLYLVVPALQFYRYPLLDVEHDAFSMYPAKIRVAQRGKARERDSFLEILAANEQEFKNGLKRVFADEETKKVIGNLLVQSGVKGASVIKPKQEMSLSERVIERKKTSKSKQESKKKG